MKFIIILLIISKIIANTDEIFMKEINNTMLYNNLGNSGLKVSKLGFGAWITFGNQIKEDKAYKIMKVEFFLLLESL